LRHPFTAPRLVALAAPAALFVAVFSVYVHTPYGQLTDPKYAFLTAESLLTRRSWDVTPYLPHLALAPGPAAQEAAPRVPYQLRRIDDRLVYAFSPGTSLLSVPLVAVMRGLGYTSIDGRGLYDRDLELAAQLRLASFLTASAVLLLFALARRELPLFAAAVVAATAALGTTLWTTASRALWTHTWTAVLIAAALLELHAWERGRRRRPVWLGLLFVAMFWVRPTSAMIVAIGTLFVAVRHRTALARLMATGAFGAAAYALHSLMIWNWQLPRYLEQGRALGQSREPLGFLVRDLIDPDRGLLVSTPAILAIAWGLGRRRPRPESRALVVLCTVAVVGMMVLYATGPFFVSGPLGPRFLTDIVPFLVLLAAIAWRARHDDEAGRGIPRWRSVTASAVVLFLAVASYAAQEVWTSTRSPGRRKPHSLRADGQSPWRTASERLAGWRWQALPQFTYIHRWLPESDDAAPAVESEDSP